MRVDSCILWVAQQRKHPLSSDDFAEFEIYLNTTGGEKMKKKIPTYDPVKEVDTDGKPLLLWLLEHIKIARQLIQAKRITSPVGKIAVCRQLYKGSALLAFEAGIIQEGHTNARMNEDDFENGIEAIKQALFPHKASQHYKRMLRRGLWKLQEESARQTWHKLVQRNNANEEFPKEDGKAIKKLDEDELVDIFHELLPRPWKYRLREEGTDVHDVDKILDFVERLEAVEAMDPLFASKKTGASTGNTDSNVNKDARNKGRSSNRADNANNNNNNNNKNKRRNNKKRKAVDDDEEHCMLHGPNSKHTSAQCKVLRGQAEKMREAWKANPSYTSSTNRSSSDRKPKWAREELNEMAAAVSKATVQSLLEVQKKTKTGESFAIGAAGSKLGGISLDDEEMSHISGASSYQSAHSRMELHE